MIVAGCDIGSLTAKAVIMNEDGIVSQAVMRAGARPEESAQKIMETALEMAGLKMQALAYVMGTGYGRRQISFVQDVVSEIVCHGQAMHWLNPSIRMVIDVGGQDAKAIRVDEKGGVLQYVYNDKCASGTGRFLEVMAEALEVALENLGPLALESQDPISISNQCAVFAETEVVSLLNGGKAKPDIAGGLVRALAHRIAALAKSIGLETPIAMSGGVAKNQGVYAALEKVLGVQFNRPEGDPQINGALGAALLARAKLQRLNAEKG
ncbi:MAG: acyl-CoA dehydratase activase [Syntrophaceae bacterium]